MVGSAGRRRRGRRRVWAAALAVLAAVAVARAAPDVDADPAAAAEGESLLAEGDGRKPFGDLTLVMATTSLDTNAFPVAAEAVVLADERVAAQWAGCEGEACPVQSVYSDRVVFEFTYERRGVYDFGTPTATADGLAVNVFDYDAVDDTSAGTFTVYANCSTASADNAAASRIIRLSFPIFVDVSIDFMWRKDCPPPGTSHDRFEVGIVAPEPSDLATAQAELACYQCSWSAVGKDLHVLHSTSTELYFKLTEPASFQEYLPLHVASNDSRLTTEVRGNGVNGGVLISVGEEKVRVLYSCPKNASFTARIEFRLQLPPYRPVTLDWTKECSAVAENRQIPAAESVRKGLFISVSNWTKADVLENGVLGPRFRVSANDLARLAVDPQVERVLPATTTIDFNIRNVFQAHPIVFDPPVVSVADHHVVDVRVVRPSALTQYFISPDTPTTILTELKELKLRMICKRKGESVILVTLPLHEIPAVEFGFVKMCTTPRIRRRRGFLRTAESMLNFIFVAVLGVTVYAAIRLSRRASGAIDEIRRHPYKAVQVA